MTFSEVKSLLLSRVDRREYCDMYMEVNATTNYEELIWTTLSLFQWAWKTRIVDTGILDEIPDADLIAQGIYYNKTGAIIPAPTKPYTYKGRYEIWVIGGDPTISLGELTKVNCYSTQATITSVNNAYLDITVYDSEITVTSTDNSIVNISLRNNGAEEATLSIQDDSKMFIEILTLTVINLNRTVNGIGILNAYDNSVANIIFSEDKNVLHSNAYQNAQINYNFTP